MQTPEKVALYDRLGGVYKIATVTVVDDFIDRIMVDPRVNANPHVDEAHHRVSPAGFKYFVTEMVCWATGGPQHYSGRSMGDSHRHLMTLICMSCLNKNKEYIMIGKREEEIHDGAEENRASP